jgi:hypothetical protein
MDKGSTRPRNAQSTTPNVPSNSISETSPPADELASKNGKLTTPMASDKFRDATDAVLNFLSTASNETLGACAVGLCATTYLVLGRVGLVLIGAAGGIVLHATWEASNHTGAGGQGPAADGSRKRRELGIEVVRRTLDWRATSKDAPGDDALKSSTGESSSDDKTLEYSDFSPATRNALNALTDAVIRDYVRCLPPCLCLHSG